MAKPRITKQYAKPLKANLPKSITAHIGRIITLWAHFEYQLQITVWQLVGIDDSTGRIAVREPRATDRINMIAELCDLRKLDPGKQDIKLFRKLVSDLASTRDLYAHGVWVKHENKWSVLLSRGNFPNDVQTANKNRRVVPEGIIVDEAGLRATGDAIRDLIDNARGLRGHLFPTPSRDKSPQQ